MHSGSFTHGALAELTTDELTRMLELDETLFVEHKSDLRDGSVYGLASTVASFANTMGGWLLLGVHGGKPVADAGAWANPEGPTLIDTVRDLLRMELDPLPAFEARVMPHPDGPVGVVRVYESSDTPHISVSSGSVFVREVAGKSDVSEPKRPGSGARGERAYRAAQIRSRGQLLELAERGRRARERVAELTDPLRPLPLIVEALGLDFERIADGRVQPRASDRGAIVVRLVPYTLPPRFNGWATSQEASAAVLAAAERLSDQHGLGNSWLTPHPSGASVAINFPPGARHHDAVGLGLGGSARVVVDGAGVIGAALELEGPDGARRGRMPMHQLSERLVEPVVDAATSILRAGEILGRCWCQVDLVGLPRAVLLDEEGNQGASGWVPTGTDLSVPMDDESVRTAGRRVAYAYARSAGVRAWDPPAPTV